MNNTSLTRGETGRKRMHKVLLLGAGKIGRMIANLLKSSGDYEILAADAEPAATDEPGPGDAEG